MFPPAISCMFTRVCHQMHVFPHLPSAACFPALATSCMFSRTCHQLHVFPRMPPDACFPVHAIGCMFLSLATGCMFSRACHYLHVFPRLPLFVACFPPLPPVPCFSALAIGCISVFPRMEAPDLHAFRSAVFSRVRHLSQLFYLVLIWGPTATYTTE